MTTTGIRFGYTRTSTADLQTDHLQRDALVEAGISPDHIYSDQASGSKAARSRPGLSDLLSKVRAGDELWVWRLDRLGRSLIDVLNTVEALTGQGVLVRSIQDNINPSTNEGRLMLYMLGALAEYERVLIQERVQAGVNAARSRGVKFGRPAPDPEFVAQQVRTVQHLVQVESLSIADAAKRVGWSRSTYYRHSEALRATA